MVYYMIYFIRYKRHKLVPKILNGDILKHSVYTKIRFHLTSYVFMYKWLFTLKVYIFDITNMAFNMRTCSLVMFINPRAWYRYRYTLISSSQPIGMQYLLSLVKGRGRKYMSLKGHLISITLSFCTRWTDYMLH